MSVKKGNEYEFWKTLTDFVGFSTLVEKPFPVCNLHWIPAFAGMTFLTPESSWYGEAIFNALALLMDANAA